MSIVAVYWIWYYLLMMSDCLLIAIWICYFLFVNALYFLEAWLCALLRPPTYAWTMNLSFFFQFKNPFHKCIPNFVFSNLMSQDNNINKTRHLLIKGKKVFTPYKVSEFCNTLQKKLRYSFAMLKNLFFSSFSPL
jgi:hypothetical protein